MCSKRFEKNHSIEKKTTSSHKFARLWEYSLIHLSIHFFLGLQSHQSLWIFANESQWNSIISAPFLIAGWNFHVHLLHVRERILGSIANSSFFCLPAPHVERTFHRTSPASVLTVSLDLAKRSLKFTDVNQFYYRQQTSLYIFLAKLLPRCMLTVYLSVA